MYFLVVGAGKQTHDYCRALRVFKDPIELFTQKFTLYARSLHWPSVIRSIYCDNCPSIGYSFLQFIILRWSKKSAKVDFTR